ncbi:DUF2244 domain-containing protein [Filomicrobium sp.]|uniref:DUF2244 domain-containing protein n=1 Tax=Filomicrobium sp. TaxID=2024831 RepID=UPI00258E0C64|nr:DUF2244 domain-containing protein [Filomicrobium sp.]MCV0368039.1 DUF2244 domain-containing protein [Filomicrobium sp.]
MTEAASKKQEPGTFKAVLFPYRSLRPTGFLILMTLIGITSFSLGLVFAFMGAWPVVGFFGLDALLIYFAFKLNYRAGREYEMVDLDPRQLVLTRVDPKGRREIFDFNTYWVRVNLLEEHDGRTSLSLSSHGNEIVFGSFLTDDERKDFAVALHDALLTARTVRPA